MRSDALEIGTKGGVGYVAVSYVAVRVAKGYRMNLGELSKMGKKCDVDAHTSDKVRGAAWHQRNFPLVAPFQIDVYTAYTAI